MAPGRSAASVPRRCPECGDELLDGCCDTCGWDADLDGDDSDDQFGPDELGDDPEED